MRKIVILFVLLSIFILVAANPRVVTPKWHYDSSGNLTPIKSGVTVTGITASVTLTDNESTNENNPIWFSAGAAGSGDIGPEADGDLHYNPSTGTVTTTEFSGGGASLTAVDAETGDSATSFFDAGAIEAARGGTAIDTSSSSGLARIDAGTWSVGGRRFLDLADLADDDCADNSGDSICTLTAAEVSFTIISTYGWDGVADCVLMLPAAAANMDTIISSDVTDAAQDIDIDTTSSKHYLDAAVLDDGDKAVLETPTIGQGIIHIISHSFDGGSTYDFHSLTIKGTWIDEADRG